MHRLRELERVEWRILGALRFVDATTGVPIVRNLSVDAPGASLVRNRSGIYVIRHWGALTAHENEFLAPPATPAPASQTLSLSVTDPAGDYLGVAAHIGLPRTSNPAQADAADSLFRPAVVPLYPSASAPVGANWAVLRVSLTETTSGDALGGALLRIQFNGTVLARGLTDWRGEALVPVLGVPVTTFSEDANAVVISEINVSVQAAFDSESGSRTPAAQVRAGHPPVALPLVDPSALESAFDDLPHTQAGLSIAARRSQSVVLSLNLP
ncbi:MAG: hypothetical protein IH606_00735 [Burkholderiales bacterium]|nr:hypothetical protein [Burkholderiales bacterium]